jgi:hypothetical protein
MEAHSCIYLYIADKNNSHGGSGDDSHRTEKHHKPASSLVTEIARFADHLELQDNGRSSSV